MKLFYYASKVPFWIYRRTRLPLSEFSGSAPEWQSVILVSMKHAVSKTIFIYKELTVLDDKSYGDTSDVFMTTGLTKAK